MRISCLIAIATLYVVGCDVALAQTDRSVAAAAKSEDQWIAEAMWSLIDFGSGSQGDPLTAFNDAARAYPQSSKIGYWQGRFRLFASGQQTSLSKFVEIAEQLSKPDSNEEAVADPITQRKLASARNFSKVIGERLRDRLNNLQNNTTEVWFEVVFHDQLSRDPDLIIAWSRLLESSDPVIALTAADAWAEREPENALPLYAKAILLQRQRGKGDPIDPSAIEALEIGNSRPACLAPDEPWPEEFDLRFPDSLGPEQAELRGQPVSRAMLRTFVEGLFLTEGIFGGSAISESAIRDLGGKILEKSHQLSLEEDIRYLRAFAGVGTHLIHSNRLLYGMTAGSADRVLNRMETIAIDQEDFSHAIEIANLRDHIFTLKRMCSEGYRTVSAKEDQLLFDRVATQIMEDNRKDLPIPTIEISKKPRPKWMISETLDAKNNMWMLELFDSDNHEVFVCGRDQALPSKHLDSDELSRCGYQKLEQVIQDVRATNRNEQQSRGLFMVLNSPYFYLNVFGSCYLNGYVGRRDPCILAFRDPKSLDFFQKKYRDVTPRLAQILPPGDLLDQEALYAVLDSADLVVVPYSRIITSDGLVCSVALASGKKFIVAGTLEELLQAENAIRDNTCLAGSIESDLVLRVERSD